MELSDYRTQIDRIDAELLQLFAERMQTAAGIAAYKKSHGLPVLDAGREREKLAQIVKAAPEDLQEEAVIFLISLILCPACSTRLVT